MRHSQADISAMTKAIASHEAAARLWLEAGFSPGDAGAYVRAGCFDVDRTVELRAAGMSPSHIARLGLGWDYCAGRVALFELRDEGNHEVASVELPLDVSVDRAPPAPERSAPRWLRSAAAERTLQHKAS